VEHPSPNEKGKKNPKKSHPPFFFFHHHQHKVSTKMIPLFLQDRHTLPTTFLWVLPNLQPRYVSENESGNHKLLWDFEKRQRPGSWGRLSRRTYVYIHTGSPLAVSTPSNQTTNPERTTSVHDTRNGYLQVIVVSVCIHSHQHCSSLHCCPKQRETILKYIIIGRTYAPSMKTSMTCIE